MEEPGMSRMRFALKQLERWLTLAAALAIPALPGCQGCNPEPEEDVRADIEPEIPPVQAECLVDGLYVDGVLLVPSDPMLDPAPECESSSMRFEAGGTRFHACCENLCCDFDGGTFVGKGEGEPCISGFDCKAGLSCLTLGGGKQCAYGGDGAPCDSKHLCKEGFYCDYWQQCRPVQTLEGAECETSDEECAWPMACVCGVGGCACYDGSAGDLCESDTCAEGLYCVMPAGVKEGLCHEGVAGDPCYFDWQCDKGLGCTGEVEGDAVCAVWLEPGDECAGTATDLLTQCEPETVCLFGLDVPVCGKPGTDEAPCTSPAECAEGYHCVESEGKCYDGMDGDPCVSDGDCALGWKCRSFLEGVSLCYLVLNEGSQCDASDPWQVCEEGLACLHSTNPSTCGPAVDKWEVCLGDGECLEGLFCLDLAALCISGTEGEPCESEEWCLDGLHCAGTPAVCVAGDFGDPCHEGLCAEGFTCYTEVDRCYDGSPGTPCASEADCQPDAHCLTWWQGSYCTALLVEGGPCGTLGKPYAMCGFGLVCADPPGQCSNGDEGQPCASSFQCGSELACHPVLHQCFRGDLGDPCQPDFPCAEGYACRADTSTCAYTEDGSPCSQPVDCAEGLLCIASAGACYHGDNGDPCSGPADCGQGFDCLMAAGKCYNAQPGSPCLGDAWCAAGLSCQDIGELRCVKMAVEGDECGPPWVAFVLCPEGTTCNGGYSPSQCAALGGAGAPCWEDEDCLPDFVCTAQGQFCMPKEVEGGQP